MDQYAKKAGHPILAVILGLLGILVAVLLTLFAGVIAGAVAGALGLAAFLLGLFGRKAGGKGIGGIITGAVAIVLAIVMTVTTVGLFNDVKNMASQYADEAPLVAKSLSNPSLGLVGMMMNLPSGEDTNPQEIIDQFNLVEKRMKEATGASQP